jgi:threonine dehydrogenase-like Zn-dependent dehydrogenase
MSGLVKVGHLTGEELHIGAADTDPLHVRRRPRRHAAALVPGYRALVLGPGTIGLLAAMFARAAGAEVHLMGRSAESLIFARSLGFEHVCTEHNLPDQPFDAVIDASNAAHLPAPRPRPGHGDHAVMLICLTVVYRDNPVLVGGLANAWDQLSRACHHHAYELTPTTAEVRHLISRLRGAESILAHDHDALRPASG